MITTNPIPYGVPNSKATTGWPAPEEDPSTSRAYETRCTKEAKNKMAAKGKMGAWWWWEENAGMQQDSGLALGKGEDVDG